ncbi:MAG: hypothetical protein ABI895_33370 [Deltaproteobacteria bacterium]
MTGAPGLGELGRLAGLLRPRSPAARQPPLAPLPEHDGAVSAQLYGRAGHFDALPFPNMEWWWNTGEVEASNGARYFLLTNVHSFGSLLGPPVTCGTVALFDVRSGRRHTLRSVGRVSGDRSCTYQAPGWLLQRLDPESESFPADLQRAARLLRVTTAELARASERGCYVVSISAPGLEAQLYLEQHATVLYGDAATPGWYDNHPSGALPCWASYRSRFETPRGSLRLGTPAVGEATRVLGGNARFDHQSLHWSVRDNGLPSPRAFLEQLLNRPKWIWYHGRVGNRLNVMAYQIWNVNTRTRTKVAGAIADEATGALVRLDSDAVAFNIPRTTGALAAPVDAVVSLMVREGCAGVPAGSYELQFRYDTSIDWTVDYAVGRSLVYHAQEAFCTLAGRTPLGVATGTGTQEVLDLGGLKPA